MIKTLKKIAKKSGIDTRALYQLASVLSLRAAIREQGLTSFVDRMRDIVPDLRDQYSLTGFDDTEYRRYWETKMRGQHAWQVHCVERAIDKLGSSEKGLVIADIGDSSGNHGKFIKSLLKPGNIKEVISVNIDPEAVKKIKAKGGQAILCHAEELPEHDVQPDLFISFETVEHLIDPVRFLRSLAKIESCNHLLMTVPYRRISRFGGDHLRTSIDQMPKQMTAEEVHIFELCPQDWIYLARFAGYRLVFKDIYYQYPKYGIMRIMEPLWRRLDFEGFLALMLVRDPTVEQRYTSW